MLKNVGFTVVQKHVQQSKRSQALLTQIFVSARSIEQASGLY